MGFQFTRLCWLIILVLILTTAPINLKITGSDSALERGGSLQMSLKSTDASAAGLEDGGKM